MRIETCFTRRQMIAFTVAYAAHATINLTLNFVYHDAFLLFFFSWNQKYVDIETQFANNIIIMCASWVEILLMPLLYYIRVSNVFIHNIFFRDSFISAIDNYVIQSNSQINHVQSNKISCDGHNVSWLFWWFLLKIVDRVCRTIIYHLHMWWPSSNCSI